MKVRVIAISNLSSVEGTTMNKISIIRLTSVLGRLFWSFSHHSSDQ